MKKNLAISAKNWYHLTIMYIRDAQQSALPPDARIIPPLQQPQFYATELERPLLTSSAAIPATYRGRSVWGVVFRELWGTLIPALLVAILVQIFIAQATRVEGYSMEPTLYGHQRLIIEKVSYHFETPRRHDIVVIHVDGYSEPLIKRVIGLPGDVLEIKNGVVFIDGEPQDEPYVNDHPRGNYPRTTIPDGYVFVMGDNRNNSSDSRVFGPIPISHITGRAWVRYWPLKDLSLMP